MQKARGHTVPKNIVLPQLVSRRFQVLFHSPPGVLFTFPSRYLSTIGYRVVFSLGRWSSRIPTGFHVPRGTRGHPRVTRNFAYRAITAYGRPFQTIPLSLVNPMLGPHNPGIQVLRFGLFRVRSPLLTESHLISSPGGTEMFHFPPFASCAYEFSTR